MTASTVQQWLIKAEHDWKIALDEMAAVEPVTDMVCFHLQQCSEKYLKAFLISHGREYPRTHRLGVLVHLCAQWDPEFQLLMEWDVDRLTRYATSLRYGEEFYMPSEEEVRQAIAIADKLRQFVCQKLRLHPPEKPPPPPKDHPIGP